MTSPTGLPDGRCLIVGLGNPGAQYNGTRHNIGFDVLDELARRCGASVSEQKYRSLLGQGNLRGRQLVLMKPQTYMNLSGEAVRPAMGFYKLSATSVIALHDDIDLPLGRVRLKVGGGHGGHNGLRSMDQHLATRDYFRIRLGVGRPVHGDVSDWVLGRFAASDRALVEVMVQLGADAVESLLGDGLLNAQNREHARS